MRPNHVGVPHQLSVSGWLSWRAGRARIRSHDLDRLGAGPPAHRPTCPADMTSTPRSSNSSGAAQPVRDQLAADGLGHRAAAGVARANKQIIRLVSRRRSARDHALPQQLKPLLVHFDHARRLSKPAPPIVEHQTHVDHPAPSRRSSRQRLRARRERLALVIATGPASIRSASRNVWCAGTRRPTIPFGDTASCTDAGKCFTRLSG